MSNWTTIRKNAKSLYIRIPPPVQRAFNLVEQPLVEFEVQERADGTVVCIIDFKKVEVQSDERDE